MIYDFSDYIKELYRPAKSIEFKVFQIYEPKKSDFDILKFKETNLNNYLVVFICKTKTDIFLYKVIYSRKQPINSKEMSSIIKKLEVGARTKYEIYKKNKNPFLKLSEIQI